MKNVRYKILKRALIGSFLCLFLTFSASAAVVNFPDHMLSYKKKPHPTSKSGVITLKVVEKFRRQFFITFEIYDNKMSRVKKGNVLSTVPEVPETPGAFELFLKGLPSHLSEQTKRVKFKFLNKGVYFVCVSRSETKPSQYIANQSRNCRSVRYN